MNEGKGISTSNTLGHFLERYVNRFWEEVKYRAHFSKHNPKYSFSNENEYYKVTTIIEKK